MDTLIDKAREVAGLLSLTNDQEGYATVTALIARLEAAEKYCELAYDPEWTSRDAEDAYFAWCDIRDAKEGT